VGPQQQGDNGDDAEQDDADAEDERVGAGEMKNWRDEPSQQQHHNGERYGG